MDNKRSSTTTQIRTFYSDGFSYMNLKFFNTMLSISLSKFIEKDNTGRNVYDQNAVFISVNFEQAYALYKTCQDILENKVNEVNLQIKLGNATLILARNKNGNVYDTMLSVTRDNNSAQFLFSKITQIADNNSNTIEMGLGAFYKTLDGYLTGINSERHLNKLTDDYLKSIGVTNTPPNTPPNQNQTNYQNNRNNDYPRRNNNYNRGGYNKNYNSNYGRNNYNQNPPYTKPPFDMPPNAEQQNISSYQIGQ